MSERLTRDEEYAIQVALAASLASPVLDGFDEGDAMEAQVRRNMLSAQTKLWRRDEARRG